MRPESLEYASCLLAARQFPSGEVQGTLQDQQSDDEGIVPAIEDSFDVPAVEMYAHPVPIEVFVSRRDKQNAFGLEGKKLRPTFDGILNGFVPCPFVLRAIIPLFFRGINPLRARVALVFAFDCIFPICGNPNNRRPSWPTQGIPTE